MNALKRNARVAGFVYLLLGVVGPVRLIIVPSMLFVSDNVAKTADNIVAHEALFRFGILSDVLTGLLGLFTTLALYQLFEGVDRKLSGLMVILGGLMVAPIYFLNTLNDLAALMLARGAGFLAVVSRPEQVALSALFLRLHHHGVVVNEIFWGLWLFPLGILTFRCRFLPRVLGVWLVVNGIAYIVQSVTGLLLPQYEERVAGVLFPVLMGEVAFMLWLAIVGARPAKDAAPGLVA